MNKKTVIRLKTVANLRSFSRDRRLKKMGALCKTMGAHGKVFLFTYKKYVCARDESTSAHRITILMQITLSISSSSSASLS